MKSSKKNRRILSLFLSVAIIFVSTAFSPPAFADDYKQQISNLNAKYEQLEKQQKEISANISKAKTEKEKQLAQKKSLDNQIYVTQSQINLLDEKINILESNISEKETEISDTEQSIDKNYNIFIKRLRAMYMAGDTSTMGLLLGADSFSDFLTRMELVGRIAEHDTDMLNNLIEMKKNLEDIKTELATDAADLEVAKDDSINKKMQLGGQVKQVEKEIQDISALEAQFKENKAKLQKELDAVQSEIDDIYKQIDSVGDYVGGVLAWPVPGYTKVSSDFGWRFNNTDYHTGIDIAGLNSAGKGIYGQNIASANSGTVAFVQTSYVQGRGYGKYLIVDHGGGISTLYGHTSEIYVKVGQKVTRGQAIAAVGSTGWSTGPHLHFEVRVKGKYTNPWPYLK